MRAAISALVVTVGLAACQFIPGTVQNRIAAAKSEASRQVGKSSEVEWGEVKDYERAVCGTFKAPKGNRREFLSWNGETQILDQKSDCESRAIYALQPRRLRHIR